MSSQKGMKHSGTAIIEEVLRLRKEGESHYEIAKLFGIRNAEASKNLIRRYRQKEERLKLGIFPKKVGQKPKKPEILEEENQRFSKFPEVVVIASLKVSLFWFPSFKAVRGKPITPMATGELNFG